jgi:hypothetical protein
MRPFKGRISSASPFLGIDISISEASISSLGFTPSGVE